MDQPTTIVDKPTSLSFSKEPEGEKGMVRGHADFDRRRAREKEPESGGSGEVELICSRSNERPGRQGSGRR
jgi:hypothetical protein